ncbi:MAG: UvrD-helicase domain-containing protein, partial [Oscillospiraceae bacterium]|nr:UvrD-helicase domain-containing protein [Oscillospiraceae bacterium]
MKKWTPEQQKAISQPAVADKPVLVSAAAGSGKTAVLVERVVDLLCDPVNPIRADKIVLVTFTKKAASEMKSRLEQELRERLNAYSQVPTSAAVLQKQLIRLEEAGINTINAFCLNLLRDNSGFIGLEPGFEIAGEEDLELFAKQAMDETLEQFYNGGFTSEEVIRTVEFFGANGDSGLQRCIRDLFGFTRNLTADFA